MKKRAFTPLEIKEYSRKKKFLTGFTLIEILVTVAVIGILATILYPRVQSFRIRAQLKEVPNTVEMIAAAERSYRFKTGNWFGWWFTAGAPDYGPVETALHINLPPVGSNETVCQYSVAKYDKDGATLTTNIRFRSNDADKQGQGHYILDDDTYHIYGNQKWTSFLMYLDSDGVPD